jgi:hypothetical protein
VRQTGNVWVSAVSTQVVFWTLGEQASERSALGG